MIGFSMIQVESPLIPIPLLSRSTTTPPTWTQSIKYLNQDIQFRSIICSISSFIIPPSPSLLIYCFMYRVSWHSWLPKRRNKRIDEKLKYSRYPPRRLGVKWIPREDNRDNRTTKRQSRITFLERTIEFRPWRFHLHPIRQGTIFSIPFQLQYLLLINVDPEMNRKGLPMCIQSSLRIRFQGVCKLKCRDIWIGRNG